MKKVGTFWYVLAKSGSDPAYYIDVLRSKLTFSVQFYLVLLLILSIVDVGLFRVRDLPVFLNQANTESAQIVASLPDTFNVAYGTDGQLTTHGVTLPYTIPFDHGTQRITFNSTQAVLG